MTDIILFEIDSEGIVTLTMDQPGQAANTMNPAFRAALEAVVERLEREVRAIKGIILTSGKKTFFAGGDLNSLLAAQTSDSEMMLERSMGIKAVMRRIEVLGPPVVAAINGTALGGGFELCLACHARFVIDDGKILLGLPEATLGLMPGAGGVVRLVRMIGVEAAMPLIVEGMTFAPKEALHRELVDGLANDAKDLTRKAREWIGSNPTPTQPWDRKGFRLPGASATSSSSLAFLRSAPLKLFKQFRGLYPAPEIAMSAIVECAAVDFEAASRIESRYLVYLATHAISKNLITTFFFQANEVKNGKGRPSDEPRKKVGRVGVLGAGMMGSGIALASARRGIRVVLKDTNLQLAQRGLQRIEASLSKAVQKGSLGAAQRDSVLQLILPTERVADLHGCDLVIESVFENRAAKKAATIEAQSFLSPDGFLATNTSTLPITGLASVTSDPSRFIGLHFFSPVDRMTLVEIIKGRKTSPGTVARAYDFVQQLGKTPIVVNDSRGFFTSRVFGTFTKEGAAMLLEGVPAAAIENAALSVGMPVGPLAVLDETSMALNWSVRQQTIADLTAEGVCVPQHPGWAVIEKMAVTLTRPGRAGGGGFYDYPEGAAKQLWSGLGTHFPAGGSIPSQDLRDRILYIQAIESARCMEEGVIDAARDANLGSVLGIGFPRWTGGTLQFINHIGLTGFISRAAQLAAIYGERFEPPALLRTMAAQGRHFA